jgi:peptidoglycan/xylan/chitin deacetylase (PgdA/CDA1 family)
MKRFISKFFKYSGLKPLYFRYLSHKEGTSIKCPILSYHSIADDSVTPHLFEEHLDFLCSAYRIILLRQLFDGIFNDGLPRNPLVISFDDGYRDNYEFAFPILKQYGVAATIFVAAGYVGGVFDRRPIMTQGQIKDLAVHGIEIGSHTVSHPNLQRLNRERIREELAESKAKLERIIESPVVSVAYPYGLYNHEIIEVAQEVGFKIGVTSVHDFFVNRERVFECPRISVYPYDSCRNLKAKLEGDEHWLKLAHRVCLPLLNRRL